VATDDARSEFLDKAIAEAEEAAGHSGMASLFDLRLIIAGLFGFYGLLLLAWGLFATGDDDMDKAAGININLWSGLAMLVFAGVFFAWARWRPVRLPARPDAEPAPEPAEPPGEATDG
jgi:hypothetical protein